MRRSIALVCFGVLFTLTGVAQQHGAGAPPKTTSRGATPSKPQGSVLTPSGLRTDNLNYGDDIERIYTGDFEHVSFKPDSTEFSMLVGGYMTTFAESCKDHLPKNKVEIMKQECRREAWTTNGYGLEIAGSRHCTDYETVGTGLYADPEVYALEKRLDAKMAAGMFNDLLTNLSTKNADATSGMKKMTDVAVYMKDDLSHFVDDNKCSAATMRFQANMLHFGNNEPPVRMAGAAETVVASAAGKQQNYAALVDDLITEESRVWMMNHYQPGSVQVSAVQHTDSNGDIKEVDAGYTYLMLGSQANGKVRVTFGQGRPECIYFADAPAACRAPSPKVISAFSHNRYADVTAKTFPETAPDPASSRAQPPPPDYAAFRVPDSEMKAPPLPVQGNNTVVAPNSAARQTPVRQGQPFMLMVRTAGIIGETNAAAGMEIEARTDRPALLGNTQVPQGATVYLKVALERRPLGGRNYLDLYDLSVDRIVIDGAAVPVVSKPVRMVREGQNNPAQTAFRGPGSATDIAAGTLIPFNCKQP